jgi:hypothetical protein
MPRRGREFQAEGRASATALRWKKALAVQLTVKRVDEMEKA